MRLLGDLRKDWSYFVAGLVVSVACAMAGYVAGVEHTDRTDLVTVAVTYDNRALVTVFDGWGEIVMQREQSLDDPLSTVFDF